MAPGRRSRTLRHVTAAAELAFSDSRLSVRLAPRKMALFWSGKSLVAGLWLWFLCVVVADDGTQKCEELRLGQYVCADPDINPATQEPVGCANFTADAPCYPAPNISCKDYLGNITIFNGSGIGFFRPFPCRNVNGYSYKVAVALSLFLGWLGADRFYLGYPALGMLKFCTVGFCGIGSLIDFILISMQIVGPSDGSSYIIDYYGARLIHLTINNETFRESQLYP